MCSLLSREVSMIRKRILVCSLLVAAALSPVAITAGVNRKAAHTWTHPEIDRLGVRSIVMLPALSGKDSDDFERAWITATWNSGYRWITPRDVLRELRSEPRWGDSLLQSMSRQVRLHGRVDTSAARALGRRLRAEAVMCFRVNSWGAVLSPGSRYVATIDMDCSLVDTAGTELWKTRGLSHQEGPIVRGPTVVSQRSGSVPAVTIPRTASTSQSGTASGSTSGSGTSSGGSGSSSSGSSSAPPATTSSSTQSRSGDNPLPQTEPVVRRGDPVDTASLLQAAMDSLITDWVPRLPRVRRIMH
jgi:hypothetical protein